jgi:hypothetical protein
MASGIVHKLFMYPVTTRKYPPHGVTLDPATKTRMTTKSQHSGIRCDTTNAILYNLAVEPPDLKNT